MSSPLYRVGNFDILEIERLAIHMSKLRSHVCLKFGTCLVCGTGVYHLNDGLFEGSGDTEHSNDDFGSDPIQHNNLCVLPLVEGLLETATLCRNHICQEGGFNFGELSALFNPLNKLVPYDHS